MNRTDIVGLVLAEIALVLLFSFLAVMVPAYASLKRTSAANPHPTIDTRALEAQLDKLLKENALLKSEIRADRPNLRSSALPSCAELHNNQSDWLFTAIIDGTDEFQIGAKEYSLNELLEAYANPLAQANKEGCIQRIKIFYRSGMSVSEYDAALRRIEEHFYALKLGPRT